MGLLDFEGVCFRRRKASNLRFGKEYKYGGAVGHTFGDLQLHFRTAIVVGLCRTGFNSHETMQKAKLGMCPAPDTLIEEDDLIIFIGKYISVFILSAISSNCVQWYHRKEREIERERKR